MAKIKEGYGLIIVVPPGTYRETRRIYLDDLDLDEPEGQSLLAHAVKDHLPAEAFEE